jgi:hypothetical protein
MLMTTDWGSYAAEDAGTIHKREAIRAIHLNMAATPA